MAYVDRVKNLMFQALYIEEKNSFCELVCSNNPLKKSQKYTNWHVDVVSDGTQRKV